MFSDLMQFKGVFHVLDNPGYETRELSQWVEKGNLLTALPGLRLAKICPNSIMAYWKREAAEAVFSKIDHLKITNQTALPTDTEETYSGLIYSTKPTEEYFRSGNENPYQVGWNILSDDANGTWGSFVLVDAGGRMINRALAGISKTSGVGKIVYFTGTVE
jgi:hypothetical protein